MFLFSAKNTHREPIRDIFVACRKMNGGTYIDLDLIERDRGTTTDSTHKTATEVDSNLVPVVYQTL